MFDMLSNIIKNFVSRPATRLYPFTTRPPFTNARGQISGIDPEVCVYCGICQKKCPALAITVDRATKTWSLDPYKCIICGICTEACPKKCISMDEQYRRPEARKVRVTMTKPAQPETEENTVNA